MNQSKTNVFDEHYKVVKIINSIDDVKYLPQVHRIIRRFYNKWNIEAKGLPSLSLKLTNKKLQLRKGI